MGHFTFHLTHSFNSSCEVLNKKLPQVVQALEFTSLGLEVGLGEGGKVMITIVALFTFQAYVLMVKYSQLFLPAFSCPA